jgi:hypothetical protein
MMEDVMNGSASWITAIVFMVGALGIAGLIAAASRVGAGLRAVRCRVSCPRGVQCDCVLLRDSDGRWVDVAACLAFDDPERVTCARKCLSMVPARSG